MGELDLITSCESTFFDPRSPADRRPLLLEPCPDDVRAVMEVDSLEALAQTQDAAHQGRNTVVVYQHRGLQWLDERAAVAVAEVLRGGPTRRVTLAFTRPQVGALAAFGAAWNGAAPLATLGLFWLFSGDDITDDDFGPDIAAAVAGTGAQALAILTPGWRSDSDRDLAAAMATGPRLERFEVFERDDAHTWPRLPAPAMSALVRGA